jgi:hypothetical protein
MPLHYHRDDDKRRITVRTEGAPTVDDAFVIIDRQAADGAWSYGMLYDTRAGITVPTAEEVHQLVMRVGALTAKYGPRGPVALIVADPAFFKAARRYASLGELTAMSAELFATPEAGEAWLDTVQRV